MAYPLIAPEAVSFAPGAFPTAPSIRTTASFRPSRVRIRHEPAGESEAFFIRLAELSQSGGYDRFGMPRPKAGARIIRDFPEQRSALLPVRVQRALSRLILRGRE